jgi:hypothetical protein
MRFFLLISSIFVPFAAWAGDNGGGHIECASSSGRTKLEGGAGVQYNGTGPAQLKYTIDGVSVDLVPAALNPGSHLLDFVAFSYGKLYVVGFRRSSEHLSSDGKTYLYANDVFQLQSVPGTMKKKSVDVFSFRALIPAYTSIDPRKGPWDKENMELFDKDIELNCVLDLRL